VRIVLAEKSFKINSMIFIRCGQGRNKQLCAQLLQPHAVPLNRAFFAVLHRRGFCINITKSAMLKLYSDLRGHMKDMLGATRERLNKSKLDVKIRETSSGGMPVSFGHTDLEHCALDRLYHKGLLGRTHRDAQDRYDAGYDLRATYYAFNTTSTPLHDIGAPDVGYSFEPDAETPADRAEQKFNNIMRALPRKYHRIVRLVCIEDMGAVQFTESELMLVHDGLDALHEAIHRQK